MPPVCSTCNADAVAFQIPEAIAEEVPLESHFASICRVCLTVDPLEQAPTTTESLSVVSEAFPEDTAHAAAVASLIGLLESLALNRTGIEAVVEHLEAEGIDPLLVLARLVEDDTLRPAIDLDRRRHQLEQVLE